MADQAPRIDSFSGKGRLVYDKNKRTIVSSPNTLWLASRELIAAGDYLSLMAQTSGGVAGRDEDLMKATKRWQAAKSKFNQIARIERFEPSPGVAVGAGIEPRTAAGSLD